MKKTAAFVAIAFLFSPVLAFAASATVVGTGTTSLTYTLPSALYVTLFDTTLSASLGGIGGSENGVLGTSGTFHGSDFSAFHGDTMGLFTSTSVCHLTPSNCISSHGGVELVSDIAISSGGTWTFTELTPPPPPPPAATTPSFLFASHSSSTSSPTLALAAAADGVGTSFGDIWPIGLGLVGILVAYVTLERLLRSIRGAADAERVSAYVRGKRASMDADNKTAAAQLRNSELLDG